MSSPIFFLRLTTRLTTRCRSPLSNVTRHMATHREPFPAGQSTSSLLTGHMDRAAGRGQDRSDSVGPFSLGIQPGALKGGKVKKWSELSTGGKVQRTAVRTSNLTIILFGASLSALLAYALATELFAKNSPTVIYGEACDRIRASPQVAQHLIAPYKFHNTPPSSSFSPPRHRNRHISSQLAVDSAGNEHMFLHFYLESQPQAAAPASEDHDDDLGFSFDVDEVLHWARTKSEHVFEAGRRSFAYLTGTPLPAASQPPSLPRHTEIGQTKAADSGSAWNFAGMFSSLKGKTKGAATTTNWERGLYTAGEVHCDLVKDSEGIFQYRYLLVDIPHSRATRPVRVFVEKDQGVRDTDGVVMWD